MAISTYSELQGSIASFLNREDLTAVIPDFIAMAEAQMSRDVRHWRMDTYRTLTASGRFVVLPDDWVETKRLEVEGTYEDLELISAREIADRRYRSGDASGEPRFYRLAGGALELFPSPDSEYSLVLEYRQEVPALSDSNTSNWILDAAPDAYLYGSLIHSATYLADDTRIPIWAQMYSAAVDRLNQSGRKEAMSGTNPKLRVRGLGGGNHRHL